MGNNRSSMPDLAADFSRDLAAAASPVVPLAASPSASSAPLSGAAPTWQLPPVDPPPPEFVQAVQQQAPPAGPYTAQLLWQRQIRDVAQLAGYLDCDRYSPTPASAFGEEMDWAIARIQQAHTAQENVAIWGDFDADGVTATAVLWEGLSALFTPPQQLRYWIPNRLTESHGLSKTGLDHLHAQGCTLIITCDTGSTNLAEIAYAQQLGLDIIITDHHTLPATRPPVVAIINPRYLPADHPLATLSGVAVAYKLVEALHAAMPAAFSQPVEALLDLVAIGLIADLVELKGDCRYLAQRGIRQLQRQSDPKTMTRPGIGKLLEFCKRSGDRPTDISFGLGPRINAVSRIQGDARFCVDLLTSRDVSYCHRLAEETELANARRKVIQKDLLKQVRDRLTQLDLSTTRVIVLADEQWPVGVLGLVAGQIAQELGRPTILLATDADGMARGSARSVHRIDLYELVKGQAHLLHRFGGHPYAAGLSLAAENLPLFTAGINQQLRQTGDPAIAALTVDLTVTVAELGQSLFQQLKWLEPYGMGNPVPRLLLQNVEFRNVWHKNIKDRKGRDLQYIKTTFELADDTATGFPGLWWGHYKDEIPVGPCDAVVELDWNAYDKRYEVRLVAVRTTQATPLPTALKTLSLMDLRQMPPVIPESMIPAPDCADREPITMTQCPTRWTDFQTWIRRATGAGQTLAIAYAAPQPPDPQHCWLTLVGIAKYLSRTGQTATRSQFQAKLAVGDRALDIAFQALSYLGFAVMQSPITASPVTASPVAENDAEVQMTWAEPATPVPLPDLEQTLEHWAIALREEYFHRQYFYQIPLSVLQILTPPQR